LRRGLVPLLVERSGGRRVRAGIGLDLKMWKSFGRDVLEGG
jgi:hypothetical protein